MTSFAFLSSIAHDRKICVKWVYVVKDKILNFVDLVMYSEGFYIDIYNTYICSSYILKKRN